MSWLLDKKFQSRWLITVIETQLAGCCTILSHWKKQDFIIIPPIAPLEYNTNTLKILFTNLICHFDNLFAKVLCYKAFQIGMLNIQVKGNFTCWFCFCLLAFFLIIIIEYSCKLTLFQFSVFPSLHHHLCQWVHTYYRAVMLWKEGVSIYERNLSSPTT